jgi:hypothetical protein
LHSRALEKIYARVNLLNLINAVETKKRDLEMIYSSIESDISQEIGYSSCEYYNMLEEIELKMSILDNEYYQLHNTLCSLDS